MLDQADRYLDHVLIELGPNALVRQIAAFPFPQRSLKSRKPLSGFQVEDCAAREDFRKLLDGSGRSQPRVFAFVTDMLFARHSTSARL